MRPPVTFQTLFVFLLCAVATIGQNTSGGGGATQINPATSIEIPLEKKNPVVIPKAATVPLIDGKVDAEYADHVFREKVDKRQSLRGRGPQRDAPVPA